MIGMWIFFVLPVFKCSVSCGTGIQVRKIDCIVPVSVNASHADHLHNQHGSGVGGGGDTDASTLNANNNDEKIDHIGSLSDASSSNGRIDEPAQQQILFNEQISMDCDPKLKPIATQSCTTGIECTTIINDNMGNNSHEEDAERIIDASNENDNDNENENDNTGIDTDNENAHSESENVEATEDVNVDQNPFEASVEANNEHIEEDAEGSNENISAETNPGAGSEEVDETEVLWGNYLKPFYLF